jgi:hypothetical protein
MDVLQCPVCELKFRSPSELEWHIATDHPDFKSEPKADEASPIPAWQRRRHRRRDRGDPTP